MELLDIVDENGKPTGETVERKIAHSEGIRHRTAHVWIVRKSDEGAEVLLQKRAMNKDSFPGRYDTSSAGNIQAGDEPEEDRLETEAGFAKHFFGKSEERSCEIAAVAIDADNRSRQEHDLSIFDNFIVFQVDRDVCPSASAKIDGTPFQFPQALHNWRQVFVHSGNERFMKYG